MPGALFVNIPARGHIHPTLPVVADLVALGEQVTYCLPAEDEAPIRPTGAAFRAVGNALPEARDRRGGSMSLAELPALAIRGATRTLPELLAAAAEVEPDYIVYDAAGKFLARLLDRNDLGPVPANVLALPWVPLARDAGPRRRFRQARRHQLWTMERSPTRCRCSDHQ